ncbi:hypothetical protein KUTeg_008552 [Tegillarca granosa]|uniref:Phosphatidic acid phosphatase type 2/haloperoxidase domain-containing protein n=1 Tax=Tegillarca granosa TaxID=220873 RepID=A0ABQ9FCP0_TEGGR|nr:hypothetical protein KUTeg_008552 [Tegillarca granosa]
MEYLKFWSDPRLTAKFQNFCGIHLRKLDHVSGRVEKNPDIVQNQQNLDNFQQKSFHDSDLTIIRKRDVADTGCDSNTIVTRDAQQSTHLEFMINYRFLYYLFSFSSSLGNEVFYLIFYPYCVWNLDSLVGRDTCFVWCLCMYLGQATKDYLLWPRPASPPVVRLENEFLQESSMPSTHAMSATAIPFMLAYLTLARYQFPAIVAWTVAVCWCLLVCLSRLYLGVHSVLVSQLYHIVGVYLSALPDSRLCPGVYWSALRFSKSRLYSSFYLSDLPDSRLYPGVY